MGYIVQGVILERDALSFEVTLLRERFLWSPPHLHPLPWSCFKVRPEAGR